ncbi:MAG: zinc-dependent metalloprotease [Candidatus Sumerlaeaceae bacterium]
MSTGRCRDHRGLSAYRALLIMLFLSIAPGSFAKPVGPLIRQLGQYAGKTIVEPDPGAVAAMREGSAKVELKSMLLADGSVADFDLERVEVFRPGAQVYTFDGKTREPVGVSNSVRYRGHSTANREQVAFIAVTPDGEVWMTVADRKGMSLMAPEYTSRSVRRHLLSKADPAELAGFQCAEEALPDSGQTSSTLAEPSIAATEVSAATATREAQLLLDVSYPMFTQKFGSNQTNATDYVGNLIGAVSTIYQRDINVALTIKELVIWTAPDPFGVISTRSQLENYKAYNTANRSGVSRNASHLLSFAAGLGGVAYLEGLCKPGVDCGVSNLNALADFAVSAYQWDVYVVAHEFGHTFGSPHTHCYDPPIDCCTNDAAGCNMCPVISSVTGTIMSYCHVNGNVTLNFHPRCITVMHSTVDATGCLLSYVAPVPVPEPSQQNIVAVWGSGLRDSPRQVIGSTSTGSVYKLQAKLYLSNRGVTANSAWDTVDVYLSDDQVLGPEDALIATRLTGVVKPVAAGKPPKVRKLKFKLTRAESAAGKFLIALVHSSNNTQVTGAVSVQIP